MYLHHGDFVVWRNGDEIIVAKFRIIGEVEKIDGRSVFVPQPQFWDTSRNSDPTKRVLIGLQFQCVKIDPEELVDFRVDVTTNRGLPVVFSRKFQDENDYIFEYRSRVPMFVQVDNALNNKCTIFEVRWERKPHETLRGEYVFYLRVEKHQTILENIEV